MRKKVKQRKSKKKKENRKKEEVQKQKENASLKKVISFFCFSVFLKNPDRQKVIIS